MVVASGELEEVMGDWMSLSTAHVGCGVLFEGSRFGRRCWEMCHGGSLSSDQQADTGGIKAS